MKLIIKKFGFSWKKRTFIFMSVFGAIWLFIEPLNIFDVLTDFFKNLGAWGYISLLIISLVSTVICEILFRNKQLKKYDFVQLIILLSQDGSRHKILAPLDLNIKSFIEKLAEFLEQEHQYPHLKWSLNFTKATVSVKRNNQFETLNYQKTLRQENLKPYNVCRIENYEKSNINYLTSIPLIIHMND